MRRADVERATVVEKHLVVDEVLVEVDAVGVGIERLAVLDEAHHHACEVTPTVGAMSPHGSADAGTGVPSERLQTIVPVDALSASTVSFSVAT